MRGKNKKTPGYLTDTCLSAQDKYKELVEYFLGGKSSLKEKRQRLLEEIKSRDVPESAKEIDSVKLIREDRIGKNDSFDINFGINQCLRNPRLDKY